jgi:hypothetical protein
VEDFPQRVRAWGRGGFLGLRVQEGYRGSPAHGAGPFEVHGFYKGNSVTLAEKLNEKIQFTGSGQNKR